MKARCKFTLNSFIDRGNNNCEVVLAPRYDSNDPEDTKFSAATPYGELKFGLSNPAVIPMFKDQVGKVFYVDIEPVESE